MGTPPSEKPARASSRAAMKPGSWAVMVVMGRLTMLVLYMCTIKVRMMRFDWCSLHFHCEDHIVDVDRD